MKKILFILLGFAPIISPCQSDTISQVSSIHVVESLPEYPGGSKEMIKFIQTNVEYPSLAREEGIQGKVYISFVIDTVGKIQDASVIKGVHPLLNKEAIRVVKAMPNWKPGIQKGKAVKVKYSLPINFSLD